MLKINTKIIATLNPCKSRFDNYLWHYKNFDGTLEDFILLDKITYSDKVWVVVRLFTKEQNVKWSLLCASKVLSIFEEKYPNDKRPRMALGAAEKYLIEPNEENRLASASAAAASADAAAYAYAAASAAYAAASAAYAAAYASADAASADAAAYADAAAAYAAAYADAAASAKQIEEQVNLLLMLECV